MLAALELLQEAANDQDDDQGGRRQRDGGYYTAKVAGCLETGKGRHVDTDRAGG